MALVLLARGSVAAAEEGLAYEVRFPGLSDEGLLQLLRDSSRLVELKNRPPASLFALARRAEEDVPRFMAVLRSQGYYDAKIEIAPLAGAPPIRVEVRITLGPRFAIGDVTLEAEDAGAAEALSSVTLEDLGIPKGTPALSARVVEAHERLGALMSRLGYPFAEVKDRSVVVDHATNEMHLTFQVKAGPAARFGPIVVEGEERVKETFVRRLAPWEKGDRYDASRLAAYREALRKTGLFASVRVEPASALDREGSIPIEVTVTESERHYVGVGANYSTSEGPGGKVFWGNRNLWGAGEKLELSARASEIEFGGRGELLVPHFFDKAQNYRLSLETVRQDTDAFESDSIELTSLVERRLDGNQVASGGIAYTHDRVERIDENLRIFNLIGFPLSLRHDTTDSFLDPSRGWRSAVTIMPYTGTQLSFASLRLRGSTYRQLHERLIGAVWASAGSIFGEDRDEIPATKRFYSGGGGSIRGYGFQLAGPVDNRLTPLGGRSIAEIGAEVRARVVGDVGAVAFVEGGNVYDNVLPDPADKLFWGTGIGLRYYTDVGPVRFDFAVPLDRRGGIDDPFQIYLSLGQAF